MCNIFDVESIDIISYTENIKPAAGKVAIYTRVANDSEGTLKKQADMLVQKAEAIGDCTYTVYYESASGFETGTEFSKLMAEIEKGEYVRLYIRDFSRLSRSMTMLSEISNKLKSAGIEVVSVD